jgi:toxin ParE1/3/4
MATFRYTKRADRELYHILTYTREHWGEAQMQRYFDQLAETLTLLAEHKWMGRTFSKAHPTWRRFEHASHIIVYSPTSEGIRVQRLVHKNQLIERAIG